MRYVLLTIVLALLITGCGSIGDDGPPPTPTEDPVCSTSDGEAVYGLLNAFAQEWQDALAIASSTGRIALSGPVGDLQGIRRDVQRQDWPECASDAHRHLVNYMDGIIEGLLAFMQQEPEREVDALIQNALEHQDLFFEELRTLRP